MTWKETNVKSLREQFIELYLSQHYTITELCESFGISRKTGHKLIKKYKEHGLAAIQDQSRAPHTHPNATPLEIVNRIKKCKDKYPKMGPKKIRVVLQNETGDIAWPAVSTVSEILKLNGMTTARNNRSAKGLYQPANPIDDLDANNTWCADYKGEFILENKKWCYPLTISDACTRMLLTVQAFDCISMDNTMQYFEIAFKKYGMPLAIRTDNGIPFAGCGLGGFTSLSVMWVKLNIRLDRIDKGHPEQNGRHERMHRELKSYVASPSSNDMESQQRAIEKFIDEYNNIRPHEALEMHTPGSRYVVSPREYPSVLPEIEYPEGMIIRKIRHDGYMKWKGKMIYISEPLHNEPVGLVQLNERFFVIYFSTISLAILDDYKCCLLPRKRAAELIKQLVEPSFEIV